MTLIFLFVRVLPMITMFELRMITAEETRRSCKGAGAMSHTVTEHPPIYGVMAEFETADDLVDAAKRARAAGYHKMDAYSPLPIEELHDVLHIHDNRVHSPVCSGASWVPVPGSACSAGHRAFDYAHNIGGQTADQRSDVHPHHVRVHNPVCGTHDGDRDDHHERLARRRIIRCSTLSDFRWPRAIDFFSVSNRMMSSLTASRPRLFWKARVRKRCPKLRIKTSSRITCRSVGRRRLLLGRWLPPGHARPARYKTLGFSKFFPDGRDSRPLPANSSCARGELQRDVAFYQGKETATISITFPMPITVEVDRARAAAFRHLLFSLPRAARQRTRNDCAAWIETAAVVPYRSSAHRARGTFL